MSRITLWIVGGPRALPLQAGAAILAKLSRHKPHLLRNNYAGELHQFVPHSVRDLKALAQH